MYRLVSWVFMVMFAAWLALGIYVYYDKADSLTCFAIAILCLLFAFYVRRSLEPWHVLPDHAESSREAATRRERPLTAKYRLGHNKRLY